MGLPEMGSLCLKEWKNLEKALLKSEKKKKSIKTCWYAFPLWEKEGELKLMDEKGQASPGSVGNFNLSVTRNIDCDLDLDFPGNANAPPLPPPLPPAYAPAAAAAAPRQHTDRGETKLTLGGITRSQTLAQGSTRLAHTTADQPGPQGNTSVYCVILIIVRFNLT